MKRVYVYFFTSSIHVAASLTLPGTQNKLFMLVQRHGQVKKKKKLYWCMCVYIIITYCHYLALGSFILVVRMYHTHIRLFFEPTQRGVTMPSTAIFVNSAQNPEKKL